MREPELVAVVSGGLAGLASAIATSPGVSEAALRAHDGITRRIHETVASLPARYGQVFDDESGIAKALAERSATLAASLDRVADRVEVAVTLRWRTPHDAAPLPSGESGRAYLEHRASLERIAQEAESIVARFSGELTSEQSFIRHTTCPRPGVAAIVAVLIDRDEVAAAHERVMSFGERSAEVSAVVDGVFAPYTFAS